MKTDSIVTIFGMVLVTYMTRAGGLWLIGRAKVSPRLRSWLTHLPGAILVSIIAPMIAESEPRELVAVGLTAVAAFATKNVLVTLVIGVASVVAVRSFL
jgi:uncharacterized membrane protein